MATYRHAAQEPRRIGRWIWLAVAALMVAFVGLFAWDVWRLNTAAQELTVHAVAVQNAIEARDADALEAEVGAAQQAARDFASATSGPHWWIAHRIPWLKDQTVPLSAAGEATLAIADGALEPLAQMGGLDALEVPAMSDGRIDPYALEEYREPLAQAAQVITRQEQVLDAVDLSGTVAQVAKPFRELRSSLSSMGERIVGGHVAAQVMPGMLGAEGPRTYVMMVQNNSEPRTTGGIPDVMIEVVIDDGTFHVGRYATASSLAVAEPLGFAVTEDEERIFASPYLSDPHNANLTPEFGRTAELIAAFWANTYNEDIDGVASIDPVALGFMVEGADPVTVLGVGISSDNAAQVLLRDSYLTFPDPEEHEIFFAMAILALFTQVVSGDANPVAGTERAIEEHRFTVWSAHSEEQELLTRTAISGAFLERSHVAGVFLEDRTASKIGYYVDVAMEIDNRICPNGELNGQTLTVTVAHAFDGNVATLPPLLTGQGNDVPPGEFHGAVIVYPQAGSDITAFSPGAEAATLDRDTHEGRVRAAAWLELKPGEQVVLTFELSPSGADARVPGFRITPRATSVAESIAVNSVAVEC